MADIAEACGIAKATMYEYFRSKEELAAEWSRRFRREYEERVARDVLVHDSPSEKMKAMIRLDLKQIRTFSGHFLTAFEANAVFSNEESSFLREISAILTYHNELILSIIEEGQKGENSGKSIRNLSLPCLRALFYRCSGRPVTQKIRKSVSSDSCFLFRRNGAAIW